MRSRFETHFHQAVFNDDVYIRVTQMTELDGALEIVFTVYSFTPTSIVQIWKVRAEKAVEYRISEEDFADIEEPADHMLLVPYKDPHVELYFRGMLDKKILGDILWTHHLFTKNWMPVERYMNGPLHSWIGRDYGQFAAGPRSLLTAYKDTLDMHGLNTNFLPLRREGVDKKAIVFGESFVVAERFDYELMVDRAEGRK